MESNPGTLGLLSSQERGSRRRNGRERDMALRDDRPSVRGGRASSLTSPSSPFHQALRVGSTVMPSLIELKAHGTAMLRLLDSASLRGG